MHAAAGVEDCKRSVLTAGAARAIGAVVRPAAVLVLALWLAAPLAAAPARRDTPRLARLGAGLAAPALLAVAGDAGTGVAAGEGLLWWAASTHQSWLPASGVDSTLAYTAVLPVAASAGHRYLAVADDGSIWCSGDAEGRSFFRRAAAAPGALRAVAQVGGGALVAVGDGGAIVRCPDANGVTWTSITSPVTANLRGVACNGVSAVAVGDHGTLLRAGAPGTEWQVVGIEETRDLLSVTADPPPGTPGRYLAVGRDGAAWRGEGNGQTWTRLDDFTTGSLRGCAWIGPGAVAVGEGGGIYWSPGDFRNWESVQSPVGTRLHAVAFTGADLLAVGAGGAILWSYRGTEWRPTEVPSPEAGPSWGRLKRLFQH